MLEKVHPLKNKVAERNDTFQKYQVVVHCDSRLTLTARKIFNVLISFNSANYGSDEVQKIPEDEVIKRLGKSRKHINYYREQFLLLKKTDFDFFGVDENNKKLYGSCSILAGAIIDEANEQWAYSTPTKVMEWIKKRSDQITLSLSIQDALSSKYSLALYEELLCKSEGEGSNIISLTPEEIRFFTCGIDKHQEYKYLKKQVIKPSLEELSKHSNLIVKIESEERKKRKVVVVNFLVELKNGSEIEADIITKMNQDFGIDIGMARKMAAEYSIEQIENGLDYTHQKYDEGLIVALNGRKEPNVAGFAVNAIRNNMSLSVVGILNKSKNNQRRVGQGCKTNEIKDIGPTIAELEQYLSNNPGLEKKLKKQFIINSYAYGGIKSLIEKEDFDNPIVKHEYLKFVEIYQKKKSLCN